MEEQQAAAPAAQSPAVAPSAAKDSRKASDYVVNEAMINEAMAMDDGSEGQDLDSALKSLLDSNAKDDSQQSDDVSTDSAFLKELMGEEAKDDQATEPAKDAATEAKEKLVYKGKSIEVTPEEKTALAQKGFDYEQKTALLKEEREELAKERAQFQAETKKWKDEAQHELTIKQQMDAFFDDCEQTDPEFYAAAKERIAKFKSKLSNPFVEREIQKIRAEYEPLKQLKQQLQEKELQEIRTTFMNELSSLKMKHASDFGKLMPWNEKMDDEIKNAWMDSKDSVRDVYKKLYLDKILMLMNSKQKLATTQKVAEKKAPTIGTVKPSKQMTKPNIDIKKMDYRNIADAIYKSIAN